MGQCRVFLVDDEAEFISALALRLRKRKFHVETATSGAIAFEKMKETLPHVIAVDLNMAEMDGIEFLKRVKHEHPLVQVIILSGHGSGEKVRAAKKLGAFACLEKPLPIQEIVTAINTAYAQRACTGR